MPRQADKIFLRLAVTGGYLTDEDADDVWGELVRLEQEGEPTKARILCVEFGFMDKGLARQIKHDVRGYLEERVRDEGKNERRIAGFELLERISGGAMGTVYKARHLRLQKIVALKLLNPDFAEDESYVARFLLEAQAAANLNHPNIVQAYDVGQAGDVHYIAMEHVDGKTIKELIQRRGCLDEQATVEISIQVLEALKHAHENSLIHRDVKPANIMITRDGQAKLLDLGLVRRTDVENGLTGEGKAIGTPYFMAPEQALDKGADYRADFYALGATMFNMVTGQKPYVASTPVAVMNMHLKAPIPNASEINPKVSTGLAKVIQKLLGKRPADRYQCHDNLIQDMTLVLSGFMPELKKGKAPSGLDYIKPRAGAGPESRSRIRSAAAVGSSSSAPRLAALAVGAVMLLVTAAFVLGRERGGEKTDKVEVATTRTSDPQEEKAAKEAAAKRVYSGLTQAANWERLRDLRSLASAYPTTATGKQAAKELKQLRMALLKKEARDYESRTKRLDSDANNGELREALDGYNRLTDTLKDDSLKKTAKTRAEKIKSEIDRRIAGLDKTAADQERAGKFEEAAQALRDAARLQPEGKSKETLARAERLERKLGRDRQTAITARERARRARRREEEAKLAILPTTLRNLFKEAQEQRKPQFIRDAYALAQETVAAITTPALKVRAEAHHAALKAVVGLEEAALAHFAKRVGRQVDLEREKAARAKGTLKAVDGDRITVALSERASVSFKVTNLKEPELWRAARSTLGAKSKAYLTGVAALKLYRADADAEAFLDESGVDLGAVATELQEAEPKDAGDIVAMRKPNRKNDDPPKKKVDPRDASLKKAEKQYKDAVKRNADARWVIDNRELLFPEADRIGYADDEIEPIHTFMEGETFGTDWKLIRGKANPNPPGRSERYGLILQGRNGRAEFSAPLEGNVRIAVRFVAHGLTKSSRFALVLEGEGRRTVRLELGQLIYTKRRRLKNRKGQPTFSSIRVGERTKMELLRRGDVIVAKIGNQQTAEFIIDEDLGEYKLSLEWGNAGVNLVAIEVLGRPGKKWLEKKLGKLKRQKKR